MSGGLLGQVLWLAGPVTVTCILHMVVVKRDLLAALDVPLDGGRSLRGRPVFGRNKTWRGVVVVVAGATALGWLQGRLFGPWAAAAGLACVDYGGPAAIRTLAAGALEPGLGYALVNGALGLAYVLGELPNSFLKRRLGIDPGTRPAGFARACFFLLDQGDSALLGMAVCAAAFSLPWAHYLPAVATLALLHATVTVALHASRVKQAV